MSDYGLIIDGKKIVTKANFDVINPATEEVVGQSPQADEEHLDEAVAAAKKAQRHWRSLADSERQAAIKNIADVLNNNAKSLAKLITLEQGKTLKGMGSVFEVRAAAAWAEATAALELPVKVIADNEKQIIEQHRKPVGVVGSITPWNWPLMIAAWHILPALRCGCTVVLRPSSMTPLSTLRMVELINDVLPAGCLNVVTGGGGLGEKITSHPDIDKIVFTGSTPTGQNIMRNAAGTLKRLTLELGGNDAAIVLPDVDVKTVAKKLFWGAFINVGQTCAALKRLYVHEDIHDALCQELVAMAKATPMGNGLDEKNLLGPLQNRSQLALVNELVEDAKAVGGQVHCGGEPMSGPGFFYPVTLVSGLRNGCRLVDEEQFGPALPLIKFRNVDEAVQMANDCEFGLGGSVWTRDLKKGRELAEHFQSGTVWINNHAQTLPNAPFGGVKMSGFGVEFSQEGLEEYTTIQVINTDRT